MTITQHSAGSAIVLDLSGRLVLGEGSGRLVEAVDGLVRDGHRHVVLNLSGVPYMDSAGLGELMAARSAVVRENGRIVIARPTKYVAKLLAVTRIETVMQAFDSEEAAVANLG